VNGGSRIVERRANQRRRPERRAAPGQAHAAAQFRRLQDRADALFQDPNIDTVHLKASVKLGDGTTQTYLLTIKPTDIVTVNNGDMRKILTVPANLPVRIWATASKAGATKYFLLSPDDPNGTATINPGEIRSLNLKRPRSPFCPFLGGRVFRPSGAQCQRDAGRWTQVQVDPTFLIRASRPQARWARSSPR